MKFLSLLTLLTAFSACASNPEVEIKNYTIRPGEVRLIEFAIPHNNVDLYCHDSFLKFEKKGKTGRAVVVESYFSELKPFSCVLKDKEKILSEFKFTVEVREYKAEQLRVDMKTIKLSPKDQARADSEQVVLNQIYASSMPKFLFDKAFIPPMKSLITSVYGTKRLYNKHKKSQHLGTDYRAAIGEKIPATNSGKIVFAGDLFYTGWTVIIDHGLDIFTVYGHLSETKVKAGEMVERGQLIALSGNTGRTSGPHLHWGVKVQGQYIDGHILIDETKNIFKE